ncbi:hypothetical protein, partial [Mycobacterium sp.]|uniref:hypothetical protein n=1 Tax=Mycobacterium sp. TaxID=1785 RepID=UPI003BB0530C
SKKTPKNWHQKTTSQHGALKRGQKNNNKNKTTKHTIEFSNNTRFRATLPLYSAAHGPSTALTAPEEQ